MSASYPVGAMVWVKMPDYPWWPGLVVDAAAIQADVSLRAPEQDLCVQCLPSTAPSIMFVNSANRDEIRPCAGREADSEFIEAGNAHPECAPAVEEALAILDTPAETQKLATVNADVDKTLDLLLQAEDADAAGGGSVKGKKGDLSSSSDDDDGAAEEKMLLNLASEAPGAEDGDDANKNDEAAKEERRRARKLRKKQEKAMRKKAEREKEKGKEKKQKHARALDSEDDVEDGSDSDAGRRLRKKAKKGGDPRDKRQTPLDDYRVEAARPPAMPHLTESDADYYSRKLQKRRQTVSNAMLTHCAQKLREVTGDCLENDSYSEQEDALLELLRPLSAYDVSYEQLQVTKIGATVGALLKPTFPARVRALANGILGYWFRTLPGSIQTELSVDSEIDRCSIETTAGARSDGVEGTLGAVGIHLYESFTEEEIYDAPPNTNVVDICKKIETMLRESNDDLDMRVVVLTTIGDPHNAVLRRRILDGKITPKEIVDHANDLNSLLRPVNKRGLPEIRTDFTGLSSPTSPYTPFSPTGFGANANGSPGSPGFSPIGGGIGTFTTLYTCPQCGASEAYRTEYTVQAHDNFPEILRCRKCGTTWNAAE